MAKSRGLSVPQLLPSLVKSAQALARPPISNFHVGAVGLSSDGRIFFGGNVEFPGLPLHHSIHAEQFLITNLAAHGGGPKLLYMAVSAAPCGHCRQFLQELRGVSDTQIVITDEPQENPDYRPISSILPNPFGPYDLSAPSYPERKFNEFIKWVLAIKNEEDLKNKALEAARESHAPYSGCPSGVALMDYEGKVYKGSYMESAAYNPSMMPVQAAVVAYMAAGGDGYERIVAAVLVEKEGVSVRQEATARLMLNHVSPKSTCKNAHSAPSPAPVAGPTQPKDEKSKPKVKPSDPSEMAPDSKDEKKSDSKDEKKSDSKDEKKGDSKDEKKRNSKDEKKGESKDKKKGDSKDEKERNSKDEKEHDSKDEKKGDSKDEKKDDSKDEKGDDVAKVIKQMHKIKKKINEFNASLKTRMDNPGSSPGSHECVLECDEVLGAAIDDIKKTLDSLDKQNLVKANFDVSAVSTNVDTCNDCFEEMVGGDPKAKKLSDWVQKTTRDALEVLKKADS
ncbi:hypothetical protein L1987_50155 [Smallanthus sonchifolius]|uniref:Uncharacterized protein n=1 Tax=Smallanthus sonchifolius TaxID=185202 RepID=A0ACB9FXM2_9ASTR|nr:hypothetical protein L1987_50155 [Smallanthus sonchifolius]